MKEIIDAGSGYTDNISIEYMGGVLASSRTPEGRDDRGARMAKLMDRLSSYQLRTHYLIYATAKHVFSDHTHGFAKAVDRRRMQILVPLSSYFTAMEYTEVDETDSMVQHTFRVEAFDGTIPHTFSGLESENLIYEVWQFGTLDELKEMIDLTVIKDVITDFYMTPSCRWLVCSPTLAGAELFLWAFGHGQKRPDFMFDKSFSAPIDGLPLCLEGAVATHPG